MKALITTAIAAMLAASAVGASAPLAEARSLSDSGAENAARTAVAPEPVVDVFCFRGRTRGGKPEKRRVFCLVGRPGPNGLVCDSLVEVKLLRNRAGAIRTNVVRLNVCTPPRSLSDAEAENAARIAVAPEPVVDVFCFRGRTRHGKPEKRHAFCLVGRPGPNGLVCDSLVEVKLLRNRGGAIRTRVTRLNVCMPPHDRKESSP